MQFIISQQHFVFYETNSVELSSVTQLCPTLCDPMNRSIHLRMWFTKSQSVIIFGNMVFENVVMLRLRSDVASLQEEGYLNTDTYGEVSHVKKKAQVRVLVPQGRPRMAVIRGQKEARKDNILEPSKRGWLCPHLDLRVLAS